MSTVSLLALAATPALTQTWQGTTADWHTPGNWSTGVLPTAVTAVTIGSGSAIAPTITAPGASTKTLVIGAAGAGQSLTVGAGGELTTTDYVTIGNLAGETGAAHVDRGTWNGTYLDLGYRGSGTFTVSNGGRVSFSQFVRSGVFPTGSGAITITGAGTSWYNGNGHVIGDQGQGTFKLLAGATADDRAVTLGYNTAAVGSASVDASAWNIRGGFMISREGRGDVVVSNGGTVTTTSNTYLGWLAGGRGSLILDGAGSAMTVSGFTAIGGGGEGRVLVTNGASVRTTQGIIGWETGSRGELRVTGANSQWLGSIYLMVGNLGVAEATVDSGALVRVDNGGLLVIANRAGSTGTLNIGAASGAQARAAGFLDVSEIRLGKGTARLVFNHTDTNYIVSARITGKGTIVHESGTTILKAANSFTGAMQVTGGLLVAEGSLASFANVTIGEGGTIGGTGQLPSTTVLGTISPGNSPGTLTVNGNLTMGVNSTYVAEIQGAVADRINVTGTAALAGTLKLAFLPGAYSFGTSYTLLSAQGGLGGTRFGAVDSSSGFGAGVAASVAYTANDLLVTLSAKPLSGLVTGPANAHAIAAGLDRAVAGGADPSALFGIYNLPSAAMPAAINQLSGEVHTAVPAMVVSASDQFLRAMLDPFAAGRETMASGAAAFSDLATRKGASAQDPAQPLAPAYTVWGAAFGSSGRSNGSAWVGSARRDLDDAHLAVGADLRIAPGTMLGFALSGGSANASLAGGLGKANADVFQAGLYGTTRLGPLNLAAALAYGVLDTDVKRSVPLLGSSLSSSYTTTAWSGRLQASLALADWGGFTVSPLAAVQAVQARSPARAETNWAGANTGALVVGKRDYVSSRSELGLQLDYASALGGRALAGYLRAAWAHYYQREASLSASLTGLAGSGFAIEGARAPRNSAFLAAGLDLRLSPSMVIGAHLDGELSENTRRIGGQARFKVSF
ncbi:autotransporter outer membrane beta-barrel domain-containing protein [Bosea sp. NPDC003192]|uniref:autotransporter outer membrane beta-barrel domain-containing protein n=1 Tax=Bosea sp. NPDC003192 TaxID=3390551 RepID=UPI003D02C78A